MAGEDDMPGSLSEVGSAYLRLPARMLYVACREVGRDDGGKACARCLVRDICEAGRIRAIQVNANPLVAPSANRLVRVAVHGGLNR